MRHGRYILIAVICFSAAVAASWWFTRAPHRHTLQKVTDEQGKVYYTCPMHPQVKQGEPGNCPICGMKLIEKSEPALGALPGEREVLYWYDPMKPEVRFDKPGKSPFMDMDLVPKYAEREAAQGSGTVIVDPRMVQNLGIRTVSVERRDFLQGLDAVGAVEVDERRIVAVEARAAGWIEQLSIRAVGEPAARGQRIAALYSPELFAAQEEFALAVRSAEPALVAATRQRLALLGVPASRLEAIQRGEQPVRTVPVLAPSSGVVTELNVREGQQVSPGTPIARIADLSTVWISIEIPEAQAAAVAKGLGAEARLAAIPGKIFTGRVEYVYPSLDAPTRTVRARLAFANPDLALKPGMFANVALAGGGRSEALLVPTEAVIRTGSRDVVILAEGEGRFRPTQVTVGSDRAGQTEILEGLSEGQRIVVSGQFLIDSEASLQGVLTRMGEQPAEAGQ